MRKTRHDLPRVAKHTRTSSSNVLKMYFEKTTRILKKLVSAATRLTTCTPSDSHAHAHKSSRLSLHIQTMVNPTTSLRYAFTSMLYQVLCAPPHLLGQPLQSFATFSFKARRIHEILNLLHPSLKLSWRLAQMPTNQILAFRATDM